MGIENFQDRNAMIQALNGQVRVYETDLAAADKEFSATLRDSAKIIREKNRDSDEKVKTTLRALKNSTLGLWDIDYLIANIKAGFIVPEIGVPFDIGNIDLAGQNF